MISWQYQWIAVQSADIPLLKSTTEDFQLLLIFRPAEGRRLSQPEHTQTYYQLVHGHALCVDRLSFESASFKSDSHLPPDHCRHCICTNVVRGSEKAQVKISNN